MRLCHFRSDWLFSRSRETSSAETLPVAGIYPAGSDEAATLHTIAVENFGGPRRPKPGLKLEDFLRDVYIFRRPWFV